MSWSPDGRDIAYTGYTSQLDGNTPMTVTALGVATGQNLYTYHAAQAQIELSAPTWSPDGRYLAVMMTQSTAAPTPSGLNTESLTVQVWTA